MCRIPSLLRRDACVCHAKECPEGDPHIYIPAFSFRNFELNVSPQVQVSDSHRRCSTYSFIVFEVTIDPGSQFSMSGSDKAISERRCTSRMSDTQYLDRFQELGFSFTSTLTLNPRKNPATLLMNNSTSNFKKYSRK